jgi:hypothetical protein
MCDVAVFDTRERAKWTEQFSDIDFHTEWLLQPGSTDGMGPLWQEMRREAILKKAVHDGSVKLEDVVWVNKEEWERLPADIKLWEHGFLPTHPNMKIPVEYPSMAVARRQEAAAAPTIHVRSYGSEGGPAVMQEKRRILEGKRRIQEQMRLDQAAAVAQERNKLAQVQVHESIMRTEWKKELDGTQLYLLESQLKNLERREWGYLSHANRLELAAGRGRIAEKGIPLQAGPRPLAVVQREKAEVKLKIRIMNGEIKIEDLIYKIDKDGTRIVTHRGLMQHRRAGSVDDIAAEQGYWGYSYKSAADLERHRAARAAEVAKAPAWNRASNYLASEVERIKAQGLAGRRPYTGTDSRYFGYGLDPPEPGETPGSRGPFTNMSGMMEKYYRMGVSDIILVIILTIMLVYMMVRVIRKGIKK